MLKMLDPALYFHDLQLKIWGSIFIYLMFPSNKDVSIKDICYNLVTSNFNGNNRVQVCKIRGYGIEALTLVWRPWYNVLPANLIYSQGLKVLVLQAKKRERKKKKTFHLVTGIRLVEICHHLLKNNFSFKSTWREK